jgi:hypothetical protein
MSTLITKLRQLYSWLIADFAATGAWLILVSLSVQIAQAIV